MERWLEDAGLPLSMRENPDCYVSSLPFLHFLIDAENRIGLDDLSGNAIRSLTTSTFSERIQVGVNSGVTLFCALCSFVQLSRFENNEQHYWIDLSHQKFLRVRSSASLARNAYHPNFLQNWAIVQIVREYLGRDWMPPEMGFESDLPPGTGLYEDLSNTEFRSGQSSAWASVPKRLLWARPSNHRPNDTDVILDLEFEPLGLPSALRELLKTDITAGKDVSLVDIAESAGTSTRSLQRVLTQQGSSFRKVLNEARSDIAIELLRDSNNRVTDVAMSLGFADSSHFARSFRRITGQSPSEFQQRH